MELGLKIQQILQHHPNVYVKGLGIFKRIHQASTYDEKRNVFLPPVDYIEFDATSTEGKDLIVYISQESQAVSHSQAEEMVRHAVDKLKQALAEYDRVDIDQLGELIRHGDSLVFKPLDLNAFQLDPVENTGSNPFVVDQAPSQEEETDSIPADSIENSEETVEIEPLGVFNAEEAVEDTLAQVIPNEDIPTTESNATDWSEEEAKSNGNRIWYAVLIIAGLSIAGILWYTNKQADKQVQVTNQEQNDTAQPENPVVQVAVTDMTDSAGLNVLADTGATQLVDNQSDVEEVIIPEDHTWYIVIASRLAIVDAEEIKKKHNNNGHTSVRVLPNRSNTRVANVIWDSYMTKEEADSALRYVRRNHVSDAWHTTVKK